MIAFERRSARSFAGLHGSAGARDGAVLVAALLLVVVIALVDYATGFEVRLAILHLIPIAMVTWTIGWRPGAMIALAASAAWLVSFQASHPYSSALYFYWEGAATCASFLIFVALLARLRSALERELAARHRDAFHRTARFVALGESASAIAHELNQPLAAITAYNNACLRLLEAPGHDAAELAEAMRKCRDQASRAGAIIQRLREVLRHPSPALSQEDVNHVARVACELIEPQAQEAGVRIELHLARGLPAVRTDRLLLEQVALNLLRNAVEAVQALPAERRRVTLSTAPASDGRVTLAVADRGEGVPAEVQERLFNAFVTTKPGGLGLGLTICRSVVESLGGTIRHEPGGTGARFSVTLAGEPA